MLDTRYQHPRDERELIFKQKAATVKVSKISKKKKGTSEAPITVDIQDKMIDKGEGKGQEEELPRKELSSVDEDERMEEEETTNLQRKKLQKVAAYSQR